MTLAEIKPMRGESLYDRDGNLVGKWYGERGMFAGCYVVRERTCTVVPERMHTGGFGCEEAGTEFTLSCGHTVIVDGDFPPRYCDECGARVVSE